MTAHESDCAAYDYIKEHCPRLLPMTRNPYEDRKPTKFPKSKPHSGNYQEYQDPDASHFDPTGRAPRKRR